MDYCFGLLGVCAIFFSCLVLYGCIIVAHSLNECNFEQTTLSDFLMYINFNFYTLTLKKMCCLQSYYIVKRNFYRLKQFFKTLHIHITERQQRILKLTCGIMLSLILVNALIICTLGLNAYFIFLKNLLFMLVKHIKIKILVLLELVLKALISTLVSILDSLHTLLDK